MGKALHNPNPGQEAPIGKGPQQYNALIAAMRFLGDVSAKIHGLLDESEIYRPPKSLHQREVR